MVSAAVCGTLLLAGCNGDGNLPASTKAAAPIPPKLLAEMAEKNMDVGSPLLVRVFKSESELEVWKKDRTGHYALLKTYPICKWSGDLGPKIREGDRQAPEGFYEITPGQMNPNSQYYLAFNLGYPNAFDRAHDRTGAHLMVHGDCSSRGCYAMTDEQISEIFALGREAFFGGQKSFQVQAYPFRMTPANMAKHRNNPHMPFWRMLKEGNDHFEVTRLEPKIDVCEKRYVFNARAPGGNFSPLNFSPKGKCPVYEVPQEIASAVQNKQRNDEFQFAQLASRGTPVAPVRSGRDGGMHPTFVAKLQPREVIDERGNAKLVVDRNSLSAVASSAPQQNDSFETATTAATVMAAASPVEVADVPLPRSAPRAQTGVRPAEPSFADKVGNFFRFGANRTPEPQTRIASAEPMPMPAPREREGVKARVSRMIGLRNEQQRNEAAAPRSSAAASRTSSEAPKVKTAAAQSSSREAAAATAAPAPAPQPGIMSGAQPIPGSSNFDNRWGSFR